MVTVGRVLFAGVQRWWPARRTYRLLPFVLAITFVGIANLPTGNAAVAIMAFAFAGLGCSALLPLTISFGQEELVSISAVAAGGIIACYQVGYGLAAFGVGPIEGVGVSLSTLFGVAAVIAAAMGVVGIAIARPRDEPAALHARPRDLLASGVSTTTKGVGS
jgi:predicted MFS family arabinose efflux permease